MAEVDVKHLRDPVSQQDPRQRKECGWSVARWYISSRVFLGTSAEASSRNISRSCMDLSLKTKSAEQFTRTIGATAAIF